MYSRTCGYLAAAFIIVGADLSTGAIRAPGDLRSRGSGHLKLVSQNLADQREYKQVLAHVNFYMDQHNARHGFIVSNIELVAVERLDRDGRLFVATPVLWSAFSVTRYGTQISHK
jgi:hypothetical protein